MVFKRTLLVIFLLSLSTHLTAQVQEQSSLWQIGIGAGVVKFSDEDVSYIGDKNLFQIP